MKRIPAQGQCPTQKLRYRDRIAALLALTGIDNVDPKRRERRAYRCRFCSGWHLTSQTKKASTR